MKIIKQANLQDKTNIQMWAVDKKLKCEGNLSEKHGIQRVGTFIFYEDKNELGRIIESPNSLLLEEDVFKILNKSR